MCLDMSMESTYGENVSIFDGNFDTLGWQVWFRFHWLVISHQKLIRIKLVRPEQGIETPLR